MEFSVVINPSVMFRPAERYCLSVNESSKSMSVNVATTNKLKKTINCPISQLKHSKTMAYDVVNVWISYFCCWVCYTISSKRKMNLIIRKNKFTESEFRSFCRIAIWHLQRSNKNGAV